MARIAIGGFQHETNTFAVQPATTEDFILGGGWPGLQTGNDILANLAGMNLPISGAMQYLLQQQHDVVPLVWAAATPSGRVTQEAYEEVLGRFLNALDHAGKLDAIYLDLHGAMATSMFDDGEGKFLEAIRHQVGQTIPIVISLDLHANVSRTMFALADAMIGYRCYPHTDMAETGQRAAIVLEKRLAHGQPWHKAFRQIDFLIPLTSQCTLAEPASSLYQAVEQTESQPTLVSTSLTLGFGLSDIPDAGPAVFAYGEDIGIVEDTVTRLAQLVIAQQSAFLSPIYDEEQAIAKAQRMLSTKGPVILADTQDNPGGGGSSSTTGLLAALIAHQVDAVMAVMVDPAAALAAHTNGIGSTLSLALGGGTTHAPGNTPLPGQYLVEQLGTGQFTGTGPMWGGSAINLGPMALLRCGKVQIIVASRKMQAADQSIFTHLGINPASCSIIALKSSVHFRADFDRITTATLIVASPGAVTARLTDLVFSNLRPGMQIT